MSATPVSDFFDTNNIEWHQTLLRDLQVAFNQTGNAEAFNALTTSVLRRYVKFGNGTTADVEDFSTAHAERLNDLGYSDLGTFLSPERCDELTRHFESKEVFDPWNEEGGHFLPRAPDPSANLGRHRTEDIVRAPHLVYLANHPKIIATVERYLGVVPTIEFYYMWWSFPNRPRAREAQLFHVDYHGGKFLKLFVYLTDVDMEAGPHVYVPRSTNPKFIEQSFQTLKQKNPEEFVQILNKWKSQNAQTTKNRKSDDVIEGLFGKENLACIRGPRGTAFLENTKGFHKGVLPKSKDRLVFQAVYTPIPNFKDSAEKMALPGFYDTMKELYGDAYSIDQIKYMNRLVIA